MLIYTTQHPLQLPRYYDNYPDSILTNLRYYDNHPDQIILTDMLWRPLWLYSTHKNTQSYDNHPDCWLYYSILTDILANTSWKETAPLGGQSAGGLNRGVSCSNGVWYARLTQLSTDDNMTSHESRRFQIRREWWAESRRRSRARATSSTLIWAG